MKAKEVLAQDLALSLVSELRVAVPVAEILRDLEVRKRSKRPLGVPDRRLAPVDDPVLPAPEQELPKHLRELARRTDDEVHRRGQRRVEVREADELPADLVEERQPDVVDDEVDVGEVLGGPVHVPRLRVLDVLRPERDAFVHADQVDAKLLGLLEDREGDLRVVHAPREVLAVVVPDVVELERAGAELLDLALHQLEGAPALERVDRPPENGPLRAKTRELGAALPRREAVLEHVRERERHGDQHVRVRLVEHHAVDLLGGPFAQELLRGHDRLVGWRECLMERVEMVVEHLPGLAEGVVLVEVEDMGDAVEHERVVDHRGDLPSLASSPFRRAATNSALSLTATGSGRNRSFDVASGESRSELQPFSQRISTEAPATSGSASTRSRTAFRSSTANGHQPDVSTSWRRASPPSKLTESMRPMSTTEMPCSRQQGS